MLTVERLRELLEYTPETGVFLWRANRRGGAKAGEVAGIIHAKGYRFVKLDGERYSAHRLAWLYMTGHWPAECVDHINRERDDNRFANLREASWSENRMNTSASGVKFYARSGKWKAYIGSKGRQIYLGMFGTRDAALAARRAAEQEYHGAYAPNAA
jgi:hypothetical protein